MQHPDSPGGTRSTHLVIWLIIVSAIAVVLWSQLQAERRCDGKLVQEEGGAWCDETGREADQ